MGCVFWFTVDGLRLTVNKKTNLTKHKLEKGNGKWERSKFSIKEDLQKSLTKSKPHRLFLSPPHKEQSTKSEASLPTNRKAMHTVVFVANRQGVCNSHNCLYEG